MTKNVKTFLRMLRQLEEILNRKQQLQSVFLAFILLVCAMLETLGVSAVIPFIMVLFSPIEMMENKYVIRIMEIFRVSEYHEVLLLTAFLIIAVYVLKNVAMLLFYYYQSRFHNSIERDLSIMMLRSYMDRPYSFYLKTNSADMIRGVHDDIVNVAQVVDGFSGLFAELFTCIMIGILLICMDPLMAIGLVGTAIIIALVIVIGLKKKIAESGKVCREAFAGKYKYALQAINGYKEVAIYQKKSFFLNRYAEVTCKASKYNTRYLFMQKLPARVIETVFIACLLLLACVRIGSGGDTTQYAALLGTLAVAAIRMLPSISSIAGYTNQLVYNRLSLESAYHNIIAIRKEQAQKNTEEQNALYKKETEVHFESVLNLTDVTFRYEDGIQSILDKVSLQIHKSESVGIIGESGAGKSTLVNVILGLLKPQNGSVSMDGMNIFEIPIQWAEIVGYVPQSVFLLDDTIRNNIAFGIEEKDIDDDKIWEALKDAQMDTFVKKLPDGLDTLVGEQGVRFSGGQRQRIAIARALYHDPEILILDEATSALDNETEAEVMRAIDGLHGKKTMIVIAHRLTTIQKCDKVYEVKDGNIYPKTVE